MYPDLWGNYASHLFIFTTNDGYDTACFAGSGRCPTADPWVQYSSTIAPGGQINLPSCNFPELPMSWNYDPDMHGDPSQGSWWLQIQGEWVGYYLSSWFGTSIDSPTDMEGGGATTFEAGGEVFTPTTPSTDTLGMGTGTAGTSGLSTAPNAAYYRKLALNGSSLPQGSTIESNPSVFSVGQSAPGSALVSAANTCAGATGNDAWGDWGTYFYFGGTGQLADHMTDCN